MTTAAEPGLLPQLVYNTSKEVLQFLSITAHNPILSDQAFQYSQHLCRYYIRTCASHGTIQIVHRQRMIEHALHSYRYCIVYLFQQKLFDGESPQ